MSDAPERIWAFEPTTFDEMDVWQSEPHEDANEYIRADHVDTLLKDERKKKALREAAEKVGDLYSGDSEGVTYCDRDEAVAVIESLISKDKTGG